MSQQDSETKKLYQKIIEILKSHGISDPVKNVSIIEPPELKGAHMATSTVYGKVDFQDDSIKPKNLFIKKFAGVSAYTSMFKEMRIMQKESLIFMEFLPELQKFCKNSGCENLVDFFPKCYYGDEELLVLDNVVLNHSFIMLPFAAKQDLFTAKYALNNLAKFHGSIYALIEKTGREEFRSKWKLICDESLLVENPLMTTMFETGMTVGQDLLKANPIEGSQETIEFLKSHVGKTYDFSKACLDQTNWKTEKLITINHGDCWNNNMLFKKDPNNGKLMDHIFVDLQGTRMGSPNLDVGYFFFTSIKPEIRRAHLQELLKHYFTEFEKTLALFDMKVPVSYDEFFADYKKKCGVGFMTTLQFITWHSSVKDFDMDNLSDNQEENLKDFDKAVQNWIKSNPDKIANICKELVAVIREYDELQK